MLYCSTYPLVSSSIADSTQATSAASTGEAADDNERVRLTEEVLRVIGAYTKETLCHLADIQSVKEYNKSLGLQSEESQRKPPKKTPTLLECRIKVAYVVRRCKGETKCSHIANETMRVWDNGLQGAF